MRSLVSDKKLVVKVKVPKIGMKVLVLFTCTRALCVQEHGREWQVICNEHSTATDMNVRNYFGLQQSIREVRRMASARMIWSSIETTVSGNAVMILRCKILISKRLIISIQLHEQCS